MEYVCICTLEAKTNKQTNKQTKSSPFEIENTAKLGIVERPNEPKCSRKESSASKVGSGDSHARILH